MPGGGSRAALYRVKALARLIRYAVYLSILIMLWWMLSTYSFVRIERGDDSIQGVSGYHRLLVERFPEDEEPVARMDVLVFAMRDATDRQIFRLSRVVGMPGDRLGMVNDTYTINGKPTEIRVAEAVTPGIVIPEGSYFLVNDNPVSTYADSLRIGLIRREWVVGRFLSEMPF